MICQSVYLLWQASLLVGQCRLNLVFVVLVIRAEMIALRSRRYWVINKLAQRWLLIEWLIVYDHSVLLLRRIGVFNFCRLNILSQIWEIILDFGDLEHASLNFFCLLRSKLWGDRIHIVQRCLFYGQHAFFVAVENVSKLGQNWVILGQTSPIVRIRVVQFLFEDVQFLLDVV